MAPPTVGRITRRSAFAQLQRSRARGACGPVRAVFAPADEAAPGVFPQVGYAIGRRCGTAVTRNRLRRRAREAARSTASCLPRGAYLVRVEPEAAGLSRERFKQDVVTALRRAGRSGAGS